MSDSQPHTLHAHSRTKDHERPLSPHLTIYKPQITSVLSITHRATGIALSAGLVLIVAWLWIAAYCPETFATIAKCANHWLGRTLLILWTWAFFYHFLNGIRHLFWDIGQGLELDAAARSGWITVIGSVVSTALLWASIFEFPL